MLVSHWQSVLVLPRRVSVLLLKRHLLPVLCLSSAALAFSFLPSWVSGFPLRQLLSSDAEFYAALAAKLHNPVVLAMDESFAYASAVKPGLENFVHTGLIDFAGLTGIHSNTVSVGVSVVSLIAFVVALYALLQRSLGTVGGFSFLMALLCVIPIHAVGVTTFGFQALGFLPRDSASVIALVLLIWYFHAVKSSSSPQLIWLFAVCGLVGNIYLLVFAYLAEVLIIAEVIRERRVRRHHVQYGFAFLLGASPVMVQSLMVFGGAEPLDKEVLDIRHPYMMLFPLKAAFLTGMRRELIYCCLVPVLWWVIHRHATNEERAAAEPWAAVTVAALIAMSAGVVVENSTNIWAPQLARPSVFFILGSMVITGLGLQVASRVVVRRHAKLLGYAAFAVILLFQSNIPSVYRYLTHLSDTRDERQDLLDLADWLRENTDGADRVVAPSVAEKDVALTLRSYALRPMYFSYKDGGVAVMDGQLARDWLHRFRTQQRVLNSGNLDTLSRFMADNRITYAVLPKESFALDTESLHASVQYRGKGYVVLKR